MAHLADEYREGRYATAGYDPVVWAAAVKQLSKDSRVEQSKVKFEHDSNGEHGEDNAEVTGATSGAVLETHTFVIVATEFSGLNIVPGMLITVHTSGDTEFRGLGGGENTITEAQFYTALTGSVGQLAEVEGHWDGSVLAASKCKLEDD